MTKCSVRQRMKGTNTSTISAITPTPTMTQFAVEEYVQLLSDRASANPPPMMTMNKIVGRISTFQCGRLLTITCSPRTSRLSG